MRGVSADKWQAHPDEVEQIVRGQYANPFAILGLQQPNGVWVARTFIPHAISVSAYTRDGKLLGELTRRHEDGFFEGRLDIDRRQPIRYHAANAGGEWDVFDPYSFGPVLGPMDDYYIGEGTHLRLFDKLGAHAIEFEGVPGVHFAVWAPNARRVSVVGAFNEWDGRRHPMRNRFEMGVWEVFIPTIGPGTVYKFEIVGQDGKLLPLKADPYARQSELRPKTASVVADPTPFEWTDQKYIEARAKRDWRRTPMSIYEVHLGSWRKRADGSFMSYEQFAEQLIPYAKDMGFTHIELLPISEHPFDPSWGYQPTGLYSPTSRFGDPAGFKHFIDVAHKAGLGIILDWVPAHFPTDEHGLAHFDGTSLYEHADPRQGYHPDWNTAIFNFGRKEVSAFLTNNALYWFEEFHIDGLRVDAVASMLYLDYSRQPGEWVPNQFGGNHNLEAVAFLQRVNAEVYRLHPGAFMIAEELTAWSGVSAPTYTGGLGFGFKWNMGFMNDTLRYMARNPIHRRYHHNDMTFAALYAFTENYVLPLSHDEVVHGKGSLIAKMSGDDWQQFAALRAYYAFMWGWPGKKLLFMGQEFAQREEWNEAKGLDWWLLDASMHEGVRRLVMDLNGAYRELPALHGRDNEPDGFEWLIGNDHANSVFAWTRKSNGSNPVVVIANMTPVPRDKYRVPMPKAGQWSERVNSDAGWYGGSNSGNQGKVVARSNEGTGWMPAYAELYIPPLATLILKYETRIDLGEEGEMADYRTPSPLAREAMAYVLAGGRGTRLYDLTDRRAKPAVYFGGKSRIIDFALSNALNSGIRRISVATQYQAHSLIRHLQRGWNFLRTERNESFDVLPASQRVSETQWYEGTADAVYQNMDIIEDYGPRYIVLLAGDHIYKMDYEIMLRQHVDTGADVTIGCLEVPRMEATGFGVMHVDGRDRIVDFVEKPKDPPGIPDNPDYALASMGIYVFETRFLMEQLRRDAATEGSSRDFGKDIIPYIVKNGSAWAHRFPRSCVRSANEEVAYWRDVGTIDAYWKANIDLTDVSPQLDLYDRDWPIWTYAEITPPAKFVHDFEGRRGSAVNSLVSGDCIVSGGALNRTLLSTGWRIHSYSDLHEAVVLPYCTINRGARLKKVVVDRGVTIPEGLVIGEDPEFDKKWFRRTDEGVTLITQPMLDHYQASK